MIFFLLIFGQLMRHILNELPHFPICLKYWKSIQWSIVFFDNFSCSFKRISFSGGSQLVGVYFRWPALGSSSWRFSSPLQSFLNHRCTVHLLAVPKPNVLLMLQVVCAALQPMLNWNKKIDQIWFLSNIIFIIIKKYKICSK